MGVTVRRWRMVDKRHHAAIVHKERDVAVKRIVMVYGLLTMFVVIVIVNAIVCGK